MTRDTRELLSESGSVFVQISDENVHHVREMLDEIFGATNFVSLITFKKTSGAGSFAGGTNVLPATVDYLVWYGKDLERIKYRQIYRDKEAGGAGAGAYTWIWESCGRRRRGTEQERSSERGGVRIFRADNLTSQTTRIGQTTVFDVPLGGQVFRPAKGGWKTNTSGMRNLLHAARVIGVGSTLSYVRFIDDFSAFSLNNFWDDTTTAGFADEKAYVVQTNQRVVERCLLMTTDPGDLVLDPTCGSGTTAFVAEKWGRRWMTCDTSRVAITLAKQRLMTSSYGYYELKYPHEGLKGGFIYRVLPHVTLKSIANNPEIHEIYERMHPAIDAALAGLAAALKGSGAKFKVTEGGRKGEVIDVSAETSSSSKQSIPAMVTLPTGENVAANTLLEWEVPFDFPSDWPTSAKQAFDAFHAARQAMQSRMDASIAAHADSEVLYDQPEISKTKRRVSGPFTVEAVPSPMVLSLDDTELPKEADVAIARSGRSSRHHQWRDELTKTGIRGKGGQILKLADLETLPETRYLHCSGTVAESGERVVVSFGPEHAALEQRQVELAIREAGELFPRPKMIVFCAFAFDPEAAKDIDAIRGITALRAHMNTDLLTEDLKKARASNQSFWLMGQPDIELRKIKDDKYQVEVHGFDYFDTVKGELVSGGKGKIAAWALDTDYDERSLFPRQVFFPMAGAKDGWNKLKKDIKAELDESLLGKLHGTISLPFEAGDNRKIAVKIVDDRGIESLKIIKLD